MPIENPSDRHFACFYCFTGMAKDLSSQCPNCSHDLDVAPTLVGRNIGPYKLLRYVNRGYYGATFYSENRIGKKFALKLTTAELYAHRDKDFNEELAKYQQLGNHPNIAELIDAGEADVPIYSKTVSMLYIVMEWIDGQTLTNFVAGSNFDAHDLYSLSLDLTAGLARFESKNLWHNDLNSDNVLVCMLSDEERQTRRTRSRFMCKIVDAGSAVFRQAGKYGLLNDLAQLGKHIESMQSRLLARAAALTKEDSYFARELGKTIARLTDEDPNRGSTSAQELATEIDRLYQRRLTLQEQEAVSLDDPFSYLNANDFPSEEYTNALFSHEFPWLRQIATPDLQSILITGPRGSGKTIILRSMRLLTKLSRVHAEETMEEIRERLNAERLAGFFISARIDIGNHCPITKEPKWAADPELTNLYFNLLFFYEIAHTLHYARERQLFEVPAGLDEALGSLAYERLGLPPSSALGVLLSSIGHVQTEIISDRFREAVVPSAVGPGFLTELCRVLRREVPYLASRRLLFLLDDFSSPKIPNGVQRALLPIVWNTGGGYAFRVTSHSESIARHDLRGNSYDSNREYAEINLGAAYINTLESDPDAAPIRSCVNDILARRFRLIADYRGRTLEALLGSRSLDPIGPTIRRLALTKKLRTLKYAGWPAVVKLCSGDISYILDILSRILRTPPRRYPVGVDIQNREIRTYARSELYGLQDYSRTDLNLYEIAGNFGRFSLFKLKSATIGEEKRPAEYLRIEIRLDHLDEQGREAMADLLRYGVFVDGGFSSSSSGDPARRLIFRKLFTPVFPTTYNSRDTWPMSSSHFMEFVREPKNFVTRALSEGGIPPAMQQMEFDALIQPEM